MKESSHGITLSATFDNLQECAHACSNLDKMQKGKLVEILTKYKGFFKAKEKIGKLTRLVSRSNFA